MWINVTCELNTHNQIAITNGERTVVIADLSGIESAVENALQRDPLVAHHCFALADAICETLNGARCTDCGLNRGEIEALYPNDEVDDLLCCWDARYNEGTICQEDFAVLVGRTEAA